MKPISILGLGYVGMVQTACLSRSGVDVILFDVKPFKNELVRRGEATIVEPGVSEALRENQNHIRVADNLEQILGESDITYICVGTPPQDDGSVDLSAVFGVAHDLAPLLKTKTSYHLFVVRSTIPPGTTRAFIRALEEGSGKKYGEGFGCIMHPEFMREGTSIEDFMKPSFTILGTEQEADAKQVIDLYHRAQVEGESFVVSFEEAELFKYLNNNFHALKVAFANEVSRIGKKYKFDAVHLMKIFARDTKLNVSPYYLIPGMPFGGYCLPKDALGLKRLLEHENIDAKTIASLTESNEQHYRFIYSELERIIDSATGSGRQIKIGLAGIAFKKNVDDLRESPYLYVFQYLKSHGYEVDFFDPLRNDLQGVIVLRGKLVWFCAKFGFVIGDELFVCD